MSIVKTDSNFSIPNKPALILFRSRLIAYITLVANLFFAVLNAVWGYYYSVGFLSTLVVALVVSICLSYLGLTESFKIITLFAINITLVGLSFAEGKEIWVHVFYFPLVFCVPFLFEDEKKYRKQLIGYFVFTVICALVAYYVPPEISTLQQIEPKHVELLRNMGFLGSLLLGIIFLTVIILTEQIYKSGLIKDKLLADKKALFRKQFLAGTSHELRTSLNGIHAAINLLKQNEKLKEQSEYFDIIEYCSGNMLDIVNEILDFEKVDAGQTTLSLKSTDIYQLLSNCITPFQNSAESKGLQLIAQIDDSLKNKWALTDANHVAQIIHNLLSNALKYTSKGSIIFGATNLQESQTNMLLKVSISDTGIGIEKENISNIFLDFWQENKAKEYVSKGTGLGLPIANKLLALMDSQINVVSTPGKGSEFSFTLHVEKSSPLQEKKESSINNDSLLGMKILLVDDDPINLTVARKILENYGAVVVSVKNGAEAIDKINEDFFQLALMDLEMPVLNGYDAIEIIRKKNKTLPVIAFTAAIVDEEIRTSLYQKGFTSFIAKPFSKEGLISLIVDFGS